MTSADRKKERRGAILTCRAFDRYGHNDVFARELAAGFAEADGTEMRVLDYRAEAPEVFAALRDPACRFFVCFNGFGAELRVRGERPGALAPAWEAFGKPIVDLMHDCPAHEAMEHQIDVRTPWRQLMLTDYGHVAVARMLGLSNARFVPSIVFPATLGAAPPVPLARRSIAALLPVTIVPAGLVTDRPDAWGEGYQGRLRRELFHAVTDKAVADLRVDPLEELTTAHREAGLAPDWLDRAGRTLLSMVLDAVKFERRRRLLRALARLPVTVMSDRVLSEKLPEDHALRFVAARRFDELLATMADSRCVLAPLPHMTGFHERAMGAFSAGAALLAAPNRVLEAAFVPDRELSRYRTAEEAADRLAALLADPEGTQAMAMAGHARAVATYAPARLAATMLASLDLADE